MKFHRVKLENLNSLYGEQTIDFEEDVRSSPLFLIIGPTGAGKSTILDAICLALFGQTPRLDRRTGRSETDVAHIMSIGTASAYAEAEFSVAQSDGTRRRYLAAWSARRAYDDPEGAVQRPERSLYRKFDDGTMRLVVADHREKYFQPGFDDALQGLSVHDFKRSILLAQGEFSAFLRASDSDKASILERLTSTDEYAQIGERASRKRRKIERRHRELVTRLQEMQILTLPAERELVEAIDGATAQLKEVREELDTMAKKVGWLRTLEELEERLDAAEDGVERASEIREEHADDYETLQRDAELQDVEPAWREVELQTRQVAEIDENLAPLDEEIAALEEKDAALAERVEAAEETAASERQNLERAEPAIRTAHALRTKREAAEKERDVATKTKAARVERVEELKETLEEAQRAETEARKVHEGIVERRDSLAAARPLLDRLPTLEAKFEDGVAPLRRRLDDLEEERAKLRERLEETAKELSNFDRELKETSKQRSAYQGTVTRARNELDALLDDRGDLEEAISELTAAHQEANVRAEALREAEYLLQRIAKNESERDELFDRVDQAESEVAELAEEEAKLKELETSQRALVRQCEESLRQNERLLALSEYRRELDSGEPCPLCGSPVHPYCASDELEEVDEKAREDRERLEREREEARETLRATNEKVQRLANKFIARKTALRHDEGRLIAIREALEEDQSAFARSAQKAGYSPIETFQLKNAEALQADLGSALATATNTRQALDEIETARRKLDRAESKREEADAARRAVEEKTGELKAKKRQLEDLLETRTTDIARVTDDVASRASAIVAELAELGVEIAGEVGEDSGDDAEQRIEEALQSARDLSEELASIDEEAKKAQKALDTATTSLERTMETLDAATKALEAASDELEQRGAVVADLNDAIAECLDGEDPDEARKRLETAVREAQKELDAARTARTENADALSTARARKKDLEKRGEQARTELTRADEELEATLKKLEIARDDVEAHLLRPSERKDLRAKLEKLDEAHTRAKTRLEDAEKRLRQHLETPLADDDETLEEAVDAREASAAKLNELTIELGRLRERHEKHEETKSRRAELEGELEAVERELDIWNTIYELIGVGEGERFKLFAQSLNLQGLVDRANHRLERLHPRYRLSVWRGEGGEPTLTFKVRDRYQANVERPLTTLSGGETFLVSLALALGLADFRRIDMPIETLLLDEGFGTLDQDSLHMALTTLHQLHQDASRQIGIISHVDALKELIDARIVVEPRGHGRSEIRFEFGAGESSGELALVQ